MKKVLLFILATTMCFGIFAMTGCGGNEETSTSLNVDAQFNGKAGDLVDGVKTYKTIQEAINYFASANLGDTQKTINISAGDYNEKITVEKEITNLKLVGSTSGTTKITYGDYAGMVAASGGKIGTDATATANIHADGFIAENIYFENSFDYLNPPQGVKDLQALAMYCKADKVQFINCIFTGYQDTLEVVSGRQYFKNCTIKGCVDFIFGNNPSVLFDNCDIVSVDRKQSNGGYITAMKGNDGTNGSAVATYGLVFKGCRLTAEQGVVDGSVALGRPWRADATVAWINCEIGSHISTKAYGKGLSRYSNMDGGGMTNYPMNAHFSEYGNTGAGATTENLYCVYADKVDGQYITVTATTPDFTNLTQDQAALYTPENIFATTNGGVTYTGEWNPCA